MPKRVATRELNHDNWDDEEEDDETERSESFKEATPEVLCKRVIKVGRRRISKQPTESPFAANKPFANFTGFSTPSSETKPSFGFLANVKPPQSNGVSLFGNVPMKSQTTSETDKMGSSTNNITTAAATSAAGAVSSEDGPRLAYLSKLKKLNEDFVDWVQAKVKENSTCILSPIFDDYRKYLTDIETERDSGKSSTSMTSSTTAGATNLATAPPPSTTTSTPAAALTTSSMTSSSVPNSQTSSGFFAGLNTNKPTFPSFNSNIGSGFFNNLAKPAENKKEEDEESEEPPKNDFKRVEEENAVFSQRVKVFVKKDQSFVERGVGMLYIKEVKKEDAVKHQLIVRADTNLGNLLVNVLLTDSIPATRRGKNNVNLICLPTPDEKTVTQVLLRVKTEEDADKLQEEIVKYKKGK